MKSINIGLLSLFLLIFVTSCADDKGNYNYEEKPEISITNVQKTYDLLRGVDNLVFTPTITSSTEGEITADNPNYEYGCILYPNNGTYFGDDDDSPSHDMNPDKTQNFSYSFSEMVGSYTGLYSIKDKRTDVTTYYQFTINLRSSVYEGWMVLCNEGDDNRVRLDMVSVISSDRITPVYNVLNTSFPEQHNATQIMYDHSMYSGGDYIYLMSETGSFQLNRTELTAEASDNVEGQFLGDLNGDVPVWFASCGCCVPGSSGHFMCLAKRWMSSPVLLASGITQRASPRRRSPVTWWSMTSCGSLAAASRRGPSGRRSGPEQSKRSTQSKSRARTLVGATQSA